MDRQRQILKIFNGDKEIELKKSEIISIGKISYYTNTEKHVGETLSRMVANGTLQRIIKGTYKLGSKSKKDYVPENQTNMFQ